MADWRALFCELPNWTSSSPAAGTLRTLPDSSLSNSDRGTCKIFVSISTESTSTWYNLVLSPKNVWQRTKSCATMLTSSSSNSIRYSVPSSEIWADFTFPCPWLIVCAPIIALIFEINISKTSIVSRTTIVSISSFHLPAMYSQIFQPCPANPDTKSSTYSFTPFANFCPVALTEQRKP